MSNKKSRRSNRRHYRQATEAAVGPTDERAVSRLLNGNAPTEASNSLTWTSGRAHTARANNINWAAAGWLVAIHLFALAAPWTFSWSGLAVLVVLHWVCGGIGICLGYHRLLTHGGFMTHRWVRRAIATIGCLAGEGPPMVWVANHRLHHARSDQEGDPHSPRDGSWWSHAFWLAYKVGGKNPNDYLKKWVPDLYRDRYMRMLDYAFVPLNVGLSLIIYAAGYAVGGSTLALSWLIWGAALRMVLVLHSTWLVNSASHLWGYRNYETRDDSRNNWWVALFTYGEGWHNNHHAHPRMAKHGHKWWEFDMTFLTIRLMKVMGIAWDLVDYRSRSEKNAKS
ncbi:acyl-CoA desaturase [Aureliella helgolandensis]|uniref:Fatty acid desaturase n=1 Tax=Aureliella helgolandensis TaxID=2527968 RepID=A0A518G6W6_9BACT|nr:fatty acid desaturase [Aureliella helgolandensis]QDV24332.1 Fatty acid desaturase [Aureliella helgolandensis]